MTRSRRQIDELRRLCDAGAVIRAIDLAHQHFADFGPDEEVLALLGTAIDASGAPADVRCRYADLVRQGR